jgi:CRISPR/Cas system-associated protein Csm6
MKVFVYYNLHKHCWSVKALEGPKRGRVIDHRHYLVLHNVQWRVGAKGRERVRREQRKHVHAGAVGILAPEAHVDMMAGGRQLVRVSYNPYTHETFREVVSQRPIHTSAGAYFCDKMVYAYD